jgi:formylglycine-generating enzyme required for sulfatase activity
MILKALLVLTTLAFLGVVFTFPAGGEETPEGMVPVKGGTFRMGTDEQWSNEEPVHEVTIDGFYIGKFEVTQQEWTAVMGNNPSIFKGEGLPVDTVSWYDAVEYCNKKSEREGLKPCYRGEGSDMQCDFDADGYRMPTDAEWEYACRGGLKSNNYRYSGSNNPGEVAWYEMNAREKTHPVGQKMPNELGIYDMSGNVWEWCWDWHDNDYYQHSPLKNPRGPSSGKTRIYRGGSSGSLSVWLRSTGRYSYPPSFGFWYFGLRLARSKTGKPSPGMIPVRGGTFKMGSSQGKTGEKPRHPVTLTDFYIGKYEVTQEQWMAVMNYNHSILKGAKNPVDFITWYDAVDYCNKRSQKQGLTPCYTGNGDRVTCNFEADGYRLPTEAEWEYACRGGPRSRGYRFSGSNNPDEISWYRNNSWKKHHPVGQKKPNELGIYDMSGNVAEWCWDWYELDYYKKSPPQNPPGPPGGTHRVIRGGGWGERENNMTAIYRALYEPSQKFYYLGFRVVRRKK